ncbi:MAG: hypothetical protein QG635_1903 [Bacteroidota bacterium]|nr:hypothetical protein [Bacteroidota bacterium]
MTREKISRRKPRFFELIEENIKDTMENTAKQLKKASH